MINKRPKLKGYAVHLYIDKAIGISTVRYFQF